MTFGAFFYFKILHEHERYGMPISVIMFDIDFFKKVNDTYGHDIGDKVLKKLAELVSKNIRKSDTLVRWGGEEFVILVPGLNVKEACNFAEKLRKITNFPKVGNITVSFGVAEYASSEDADNFIKRVDDTLYTAKERGRNRVEIAG